MKTNPQTSTQEILNTKHGIFMADSSRSYVVMEGVYYELESKYLWDHFIYVPVILKAPKGAVDLISELNSLDYNSKKTLDFLATTSSKLLDDIRNIVDDIINNDNLSDLEKKALIEEKVISKSRFIREVAIQHLDINYPKYGSKISYQTQFPSGIKVFDLLKKSDLYNGKWHTEKTNTLNKYNTVFYYGISKTLNPVQFAVRSEQISQYESIGKQNQLIVANSEDILDRFLLTYNITAAHKIIPLSKNKTDVSIVNTAIDNEPFIRYKGFSYTLRSFREIVKNQRNKGYEPFIFLGKANANNHHMEDKIFKIKPMEIRFLKNARKFQIEAVKQEFQIHDDISSYHRFIEQKKN